jgi:hypothetical protein
MSKSQLGIRIDPSIKKALTMICASRGLKINKFVENALLDKIEELEDIEDLKKLRRESTRPFDEVIKELKLDEKI